jgi:hypothetical protein
VVVVVKTENVTSHCRPCRSQTTMASKPDGRKLASEGRKMSFKTDFAVSTYCSVVVG